MIIIILKIITKQVAILNEEDIPQTLLTTLIFAQLHDNTMQEIHLTIQNIVNDEGVHDISRNLRKCIFPEEKFPTTYKYYSYGVCVTECLKRAQLRQCNCVHFNMINGGNYESLHNSSINNNDDNNDTRVPIHMYMRRMFITIFA